METQELNHLGKRQDFCNFVCQFLFTFVTLRHLGIKFEDDNFFCKIVISRWTSTRFDKKTDNDLRCSVKTRKPECEN